MPGFQRRDDLGQRGLPAVQEYEEVVEKVGRFREQFVPVARDTGKRQFNAFLAKLLGDALRTGRYSSRSFRREPGAR